MNLTLVVPRTFRRSKHISTWNKNKPAVEFGDSKAQYILGLSEEDMRSVRNNSVSSSSTARRYDSNSSEATTALVLAVTVTDHSKDDQISAKTESTPSLNLVRETYVKRSLNSTDATSDSGRLRDKSSSSTLHSYYDKTKTPLSVSQQTSESSTRDFALRKGTSSVITCTSEEMEHARQLRMFSSSKDLRKLDAKNKLVKSPGRPTTTISQVSREPPLSTSSLALSTDDHPNAYPDSSLGNISVVPAKTNSDQDSPADDTPVKRTRHHFSPVQQISQHPQIKIHVRRPKAGTKHWFDSFDDDLSDEDLVDEPELLQTFVSEVEEAFQNNRISSSTEDMTSKQTKIQATTQTSPQPSIRSISEPLEDRVKSFPLRNSSLTQQQKMQKVDPFCRVNLNMQSALNLSSSDDEEDLPPPVPVSVAKTKTSFRESVLSEIEIDDDSEIEIGLAQAIQARSKAALAPPKAQAQPQKPDLSNLKVPMRNSSRLGTYYNDRSSENMVSGDDIMSSFPATPTEPRSLRKSSPRDSALPNEGRMVREPMSRARTSQKTANRESISSYMSHIDSDVPTELQRESVISDDDESMISTRVMTVTKQEENLIAAMRLKKAAMRRAEALANRQGALRLLELGDPQIFREPRRPRSVYGGFSYSRAKAAQAEKDSHRIISHRRSRSGDIDLRPDSVTTFQTSLPDRSVRDSQATFMTDLSEELQLPYSTSSVAAIVPSSFRRMESRQESERDAQYSTTSDSSGKPHESNRDTVLSRDSHVVALDPLDRQLLREEIPSQLFMERPFLGWEARANMQTAAH